MKWKLTTLNICVALSALVAQSVRAGLSISDSPMFVTEVLAPNVIISPVYNNDWNEVSLKDFPYDTYNACSQNKVVNGKTCSYVDAEDSGYTIKFWAGTAVVGNQGAYRVTPWPGACKVDGGGCKGVTPGGATVSNGWIYSNTTMYPSDWQNINGLNTFTPLEYTAGTESNEPAEEMYPESSRIDNISKARVRYIRSDKNYLYFNPALANWYSPWPILGSHSSHVINYDDGTAEQPYYNPLKKQQSGADIKALLSGGKNWGYYRIPNMGTTAVSEKIEVDNFIGQYWTYKGGDIWRSTNYDRHVWTETSRTGFANWFTYWRSSYLATRGLLAKVLYNLGPSGTDVLGRFRLGLYSKGVPTGVVTGDSNTVINTLAGRIYDFNTDFSGWDFYSATEYFKTLAPYRDNPSDTSSKARSCRRNYEIIVTPDYTGLRKDYFTKLGDPDTPNRPSHADKDMGAPYADDLKNQWGDVGAYGWKTDLMPGVDMPNNLLPGVRNPATWQHVVRYVVGPKASGNIFPDSVREFSDADPIFKQQTAATWAQFINGPNPMAASIDDLWHMALNSRGFFFTGDNIKDAVTRLVKAFNDVLVQNVSGSAVATNTSSLRQGGKIYQATVESDWKGHLRAYSVTPNAAGTILSINYGSELWDFAIGVSLQADGTGWDSGRKIVTYDGGGVRFLWDNIGATAKSLLKTAVPTGVTDADAYGEKLLQYLRGSGDCEDGHLAATNADCTSGVAYTFRRRNIDREQTGPYSSNNSNGRNVLGDISNSSPWLVSPPAAGRSDVDFPGYNAFRVAQKSRLNVLYVGANDGMLHAVDASDGADKGKELFAYIPSFVHGKLYELAGAGYAHKFFVDGSPFSADVDLSGWKTVLAGGANKGGKGYYLLDVTAPVKETESQVADMVKWEFTHPRDLHYTFNLPVADSSGQARQIVRMNDEKLALIVGNGYPEEAGKRACLFILYLSGPGADAGDAAGVDYHGAGYHKLCAGATTYASDGGLDTNGLSTPTPVDLDGDGKVDVIYAGDLNGNMWRFNVPTTVVTTTTEVDGSPVTTNEYTNHWAVASTDPIFVAKNAAGVRQPIITPPELALHTVGTTSGPLVLFGTGKYIESSDRANTGVQSFYGVWDRGLSGITRSSLFAQTFEEVTSSTITTTVNSQSVVQSLAQPIRKQAAKLKPTYCSVGDATNCTTDHTHLGWYWDMPTSGERLTGKMSLINGIILFNTFYPATESYDCDGEGSGTTMCTRLDPCQYGGDGWRMGLNAVNGYMEDQFPVFDVNQDGVVNSSDALAAGIKVGAEMGGVTYAKGIGNTYVGIGAATNVSNIGTKNAPTIDVGTAGSGRVSWFELLD